MNRFCVVFLALAACGGHHPQPPPAVPPAPLFVAWDEHDVPRLVRFHLDDEKVEPFAPPLPEEAGAQVDLIWIDRSGERAAVVFASGDGYVLFEAEHGAWRTGQTGSWFNLSSDLRLVLRGMPDGSAAVDRLDGDGEPRTIATLSSDQLGRPYFPRDSSYLAETATNSLGIDQTVVVGLDGAVTTVIGLGVVAAYPGRLVGKSQSGLSWFDLQGHETGMSLTDATILCGDFAARNGRLLRLSEKGATDLMRLDGTDVDEVAGEDEPRALIFVHHGVDGREDVLDADGRVLGDWPPAQPQTGILLVQLPPVLQASADHVVGVDSYLFGGPGRPTELTEFIWSADVGGPFHFSLLRDYVDLEALASPVSPVRIDPSGLHAYYFEFVNDRRSLLVFDVKTHKTKVVHPAVGLLDVPVLLGAAFSDRLDCP